MRALLVWLFVVIPALLVQAEKISTGDFAAGYALEIEGSGPIHALELPLEVYHTVRRADLGDIRVFNGAGEVVPHSLRGVVPDNSSGNVREKAAIPFFPLYQSTMTTGQADLAMRVVRNSVGTIVNITTEPLQGSEQSKITGYLFDLSGLKWPAGELEFRWVVGQDSSVFNIALQHSNDLQYWTTLVGSAPLVDLQHGGERVEKRTVALSSPPRKYLHLTWQDNGRPFRMEQLTGLSRVLPSLQRRQWAEVADGNAHSSGKDLAIEYETSFRLPVNSAQMNFPDKNPMARIALQSRASSKDPWRKRCEQVFFTLHVADSEIRNEPCVFPSTGDRFWRVEVREDGAGIGEKGGLPILQLGWHPSELVFVARGAPPYLLAFGSSKLEQQAMENRGEMVLQAIKAQPQTEVVRPVRLGKRIELGGDKALQPLPLPLPWKKWLLWSILILGVGLLAGMARSLVKDMNKSEGASKTDQH